MTPNDVQQKTSALGSTDAMRRERDRHAHRFAVASGKGGVGKTWFAISLATAFARQGKKTLLVDGDLGLANVDVQLGLVPERDLGSVLQEGISLGAVVTPCEQGGFDVLAGRAGSGSLSSLPAMSLERILLALSNDTDYDVVLFDLGAGIDRYVRRMACWANTLLVMATDEPTSLTDAYVVLKVHANDKRRLALASEAPPTADARIVINQASNHLAGRQTYETLARVCVNYLHFSPRLAGIIQYDDRVRDAIRAQVAFPTRYPISPAAVDIERIALDLSRPEAATTMLGL